MGRIITFAQQKGGAGKTTVLAHLAVAWAQAGMRVAVIDLDPQRSLTRWAKLRQDPGITLVESKDYRAGTDMKAAARGHDLVLVDCPGAALSLLEAAIRESDLVIAPCQPSVMDVWATESVLAAAKRLRTPVRVLLNRVPPRGAAAEDAAAELGAAQESLLASRLGSRVAFAKAMRSGRTAPEIAQRSPAAAEVAALRGEVDALLRSA
jgi:chromosome partitioning protein